MRFGFHLFMVDPAEHQTIARTADEAGWDSIQVADAPFFPEQVSAPYPYTPDGGRFWPLDIPVLDPWVAITAMAVVTRRIRFLPAVLRLAIRQPLLEAKSLCSVAALGVGLAWMPEEFKWLGVDMKTRGARQDEAIQVIRLLLQGGMQEFHGEHFDFDRVVMAPVPKKRIPIYVAGGYYTEGKGMKELQDEVSSYVALGARAVKMKIGAVPINWYRGDYAYGNDIAVFPQTNFGLILWEQVAFAA